MVTRRTTSNSFLPAGVATSISSPTLRLSRALPMGEVVEMRPFSASTSSLLTSEYSIFASRCTSSTVSREPYPERSLGILVRFSMLRSPMRFFSWVILRLTKLWRSLAYLYSAFSERSPWARATAISLGSSTFSSWSRRSISSWSFCLIFAIGSGIAIHQKRVAREGWSLWTNRPRAEKHYRWCGIAATRWELEYWGYWTLTVKAWEAEWPASSLVVSV